MSKIAVVLTNMFEDVEYTDPAHSFEENGHTLTVISDEKGKELTGKQGDAKVTADKGIEEVSEESFDALFIPGGFSPDILRGDDRFVELVKRFMYKDKPVFAICHGPQLLITAESLQGRKITGFKSIQTDLKYAGGNVFDEEVVVCGNLVSSRQPGDIPAFIAKSLDILSKSMN